MKNYKLSKSELEEKLDARFQMLHILCKNSEQYPIGSILWQEHIRLIAVLLRSLVYKGKNEKKSFIAQCGFDNKLFFKYDDSLIGDNLYKCIKAPLVVTASGGITHFVEKPIVPIENDDYLLSYDIWLNKIFFYDDSTINNPISRLELVVEVANQEGAHIDKQLKRKLSLIMIDKYIENRIFKNEKLLLTIYKCISVTAKELVYSYYFFKGVSFKETNIKSDYSLLLYKKQSDVFYYYLSFIEKEPINWIETHNINYSSSCYKICKYNVTKGDTNFNLFIANSNIKPFYHSEENLFSFKSHSALFPYNH